MKCGFGTSAFVKETLDNDAPPTSLCMPDEVDGGRFVHLIRGGSSAPVKGGVSGLVFHQPVRLGAILAQGDCKLF